MNRSLLRSPEMRTGSPTWWERPGLDVHDGRLRIAGRDAEQIARTNGTPIFAHDLASAREQAFALRDAMAAAGLTHRIRFALKAQRDPEFLRFLRRIDREFPGKTALHLVMDNNGTHNTAEVKSWLKAHPRFVTHFVPTSCSWLNLIERWFAELTNKRIRRGSFLSVPDLVAAIQEFLAVWNENPKPFVWTATVDSIVAKLARCRQTLEQIQPGSTAPKTRKRKSS